ncbi:PAS domain-containing protein [Asaccharospora irregularis]
MVGNFMDECLVKMDGDCKDVLIGLINIELNDNLTVIKANSIYYNLVGYTQDEFKDDFNSSLLKITYYKDKDKLVHKLLYNSKEESYINIEFRVVKKNGDLA